MSTIAQLVADISAAPAPVVFLDTCAILDVARAPMRGQPDSVPAAMDLIRLAAQSPPGVYLLVADIVEREWADHIASARKAATDAVEAHIAVSAVATSTGVVACPPPPPQLHQLPIALEQLSQRLLWACRVIDREPTTLSAALDRVVAKRRPSTKGQVKDCHIVEHCLAVARSLGEVAFLHHLLFVSSNTDDFAARPSTAIHADLAGDFSAVGLRYAVTVGAAVAELRSANQIP